MLTLLPVAMLHLTDILPEHLSLQLVNVLNIFLNPIQQPCSAQQLHLIYSHITHAFLPFHSRDKDSMTHHKWCHAVMWHGPSIRRCAQQRSPSGQLALASAKRACPPSWCPARLLAACTATWQPRRWPSQPPHRLLRNCLPCPPWTSTSQ